MATPTAAAAAAAAAAATEAETEAALRAQTLAATAAKPKGLWGLPVWAWVAIGAVALVIILVIVGEIVRRRRGGGGGSAYTLVANSNPVCDVADNKCDVASGTMEASADACKARCDRTTGCEGVLFDRSGVLGGANCWVKRFNTSPPKTEPWTGADFYYKARATA